MKSRVNFCRATMAAAIGLGALASLTGPHSVRAKDPAAAREFVEMFTGMKSGDLEVQYIPKNAKAATILIRNRTDRPISVKLPDAFAGVPALAQFGGGMGGGGFGGGGGGFGGGGGGFGGGQQSQGGGGGGDFADDVGGFFNVAPEKVRKIEIDAVCLEHGKADPNPRVKYVIVPIEKVTKDPSVIELCKMLGRGEIPQNTAQAAAWRLANGLSWQELASKERVHLRNGYVEMYFSPKEIAYARRVADEAARRGKTQSDDSLGSRLSLGAR